MTRRLPTRRAGFTFVELLIVIAIIGLLAALLLAGISKVTQLAKTTTASADISQLDAAAQKFKSDFGFFPPTTFTIPTVKNSADVNYQKLASMFPRWAMNQQPDGTPIALPIAQPLANAGLTLNGNQSMVYFLGGPAQTGWATDGPYAPAAAATAIKPPLFDFKSDRLVAGNDGRLGGLAGGMSAAPVYLDPFKSVTNGGLGTPYAYLASAVGGKYPATACYGVNPFSESAAKYVNTGGVQIISAGENNAFGPGGTFVAGQGNYGEGDPGADDVANFNGGSKLGVGR